MTKELLGILRIYPVYNCLDRRDYRIIMLFFFLLLFNVTRDDYLGL